MLPFIKEANIKQVTDKAFMADLPWVLFNKSAAKETGDGLFDGLFGGTMGYPSAPAWLGSIFS